MSNIELKEKALSGIAWGMLEKFSMQIVTFVVGIILARLLSPSDYGLIAMATVFVTISQILVDSGFSLALIRKKELTELDYSTVFVLNMVLSALMCVILFLTSPYIAAFYNEPLLLRIINLNAVYILLGSLLSIQSTRLQAELKFKAKSIINMIETLVAGVVSLVMAFSGFGVWSLIYPKFIVILVGFFLYWRYLHWIPKMRYSHQTAKSLFSFGYKLMLSTIIDTFYNNMFPMVIGKYFSAANLGFFSKGQAFANLPSTTITTVLGGVAYPVLSKVQDDKIQLRQIYRRMLCLSAYVVFPLMVGIAVLAHPLIIALLTEKWQSCIIYLQILAISMMFYPIHALNLNLLQVRGRSDLFLRLEIIKKVIGVSILLLTLRFGLVWICIGMLCSSIICLCINTYYTGKMIDLGYLQQMSDFVPFLVLSFSMGLVIYISILPITSIFLQLFVGIAVGLIYYYVVSKLVKSKELAFLQCIVSDILKQKCIKK